MYKEKKEEIFYAESECFSTAAKTTTWSTYFPVSFTLTSLFPFVSSVTLVNVARNRNTGTPTLIFELWRTALCKEPFSHTGNLFSTCHYFKICCRIWIELHVLLLSTRTFKTSSVFFYKYVINSFFLSMLFAGRDRSVVLGWEQNSLKKRCTIQLSELLFISLYIWAICSFLLLPLGEEGW